MINNLFYTRLLKIFPHHMKTQIYIGLHFRHTFYSDNHFSQENLLYWLGKLFAQWTHHFFLIGSENASWEFHGWKASKQVFVLLLWLSETLNTVPVLFLFSGGLAIEVEGERFDVIQRPSIVVTSLTSGATSSEVWHYVAFFLFSSLELCLCETKYINGKSSIEYNFVIVFSPPWELLVWLFICLFTLLRCTVWALIDIIWH